MNPRLPEGRTVVDVTGFMINPSCLWKKQNGGKKMETLGDNGIVSPMTNCKAL